MTDRLIAAWQGADVFSIAVLLVGGGFVLLVIGAQVLGWISGPPSSITSEQEK